MPQGVEDAPLRGEQHAGAAPQVGQDVTGADPGAVEHTQVGARYRQVEAGGRLGEQHRHEQQARDDAVLAGHDLAAALLLGADGDGGGDVDPARAQLLGHRADRVLANGPRVQPDRGEGLARALLPRRADTVTGSMPAHRPLQTWSPYGRAGPAW